MTMMDMSLTFYIVFTNFKLQFFKKFEASSMLNFSNETRFIKYLNGGCSDNVVW